MVRQDLGDPRVCLDSITLIPLASRNVSDKPEQALRFSVTELARRWESGAWSKDTDNSQLRSGR